jgi:plastocyanin
MSTLRDRSGLALLVVSLSTLGACGGDATKKGDEGSTPPSVSSSTATNVPKPTGKVITIEMTTDEKGNYFTPTEIEAKPGDVLKFTLVAGVHNIDFLADSNPGVPNLPPPSAFLQLPGQTLEIPVNFAPGKSYYFQCDPHALLGMKGRLTVED